MVWAARDAVVSLAFEAVQQSGAGARPWRVAHCATSTRFRISVPTEPPGLSRYPLCDQEDEMGKNVEQIDEQDDEKRLERVAAIDVAKATGMVV